VEQFRFMVATFLLKCGRSLFMVKEAGENTNRH
jgi:hypothetical protein